MGRHALRGRWWLAALSVGSTSLLVLPGWQDPLVVGLAVAGAVAAYAARWHLAPLTLVAVLSLGLAGVWPAAFLASYLVALQGSRSMAAAWVGCAVTATVLRTSLPGASAALADPAEAAPALVIFLVVPLMVGSWVQERHKVLAGLREQNERLERERHAVAARERTQERARIAREMHDVVAHKVSLMVIHAGAIDMGTSEPSTRAEAQLVQDLGREAMGNLRDVLAVLRDERETTAGTRPTPGLVEVGELIEQSQRAGLTVTRREHGSPRCVSEAVGAAIYRVVQEALTNVHRHAGDAVVEVRFAWSPRAVEVTVANRSSRRGPALPSSGLGLVGLRERVAALGGTFAAGETNSADGSFEVSASLPLVAPRAGVRET
jgi:signal transduction histidine kinase